MPNNLFKGYRASDKQINWIYNFIEERSTDGSYLKDGKQYEKEKSLTCERLMQELTYNTFYKGMQNASMAQASLLIGYLQDSHYQKAVKLFKQLNIIL